ncbi:MAG: sodium:proton antiporter [Clostridiales bacterium]|nr:sodium:proton antiporter [Clostridiales bacterium]
MMLENAYSALYAGALLFLSILTLFCLFRAILGPRIADRVVSINMISTLTMVMISVLAMYQGQGYLVDVALIYALLGFLAVVVLCKIYMGIALEKQEKRMAAAQRSIDAKEAGENA